MLKEILPPVTPKELDEEVATTMAKFKSKGDNIDEKEFIECCLENSYWQSAGPLVVKELIFLDVLNGHYFGNRKLLSDEEYDALKESLVWEVHTSSDFSKKKLTQFSYIQGSMVATLKAKEARFINAVAKSRQGLRHFELFNAFCQYLYM